MKLGRVYPLLIQVAHDPFRQPWFEFNLYLPQGLDHRFQGLLAPQSVKDEDVVEDSRHLPFKGAKPQEEIVPQAEGKAGVYLRIRQAWSQLSHEGVLSLRPQPQEELLELVKRDHQALVSSYFSGQDQITQAGLSG